MNRLSAALSFALVASLAAPAFADVPSVDDVKSFVKPLTPSPSDPITGAAKDTDVAKLGVPFMYDGFTYAAQDAKATKACTKTYGKTGTVTDAKKLPAFFDCMIYANYLAPLQDTADWAAADLAKLPAPFKSSKAKLTKIAKDHAVVISHFLEEGEGTFDNWNLYAVRKDADGSLKLDILLTGSAKAKTK